MSSDVLAANAILKIIESSNDGADFILLSSQQRILFKEACIFTRSNIDCKFSFQSFFKNLCYPPFLPLELVWKLHCVGLLPLEMYLVLKADDTVALNTFCKSYNTLCTSALASDEASVSIVSGILSLCVMHCFGKCSSEDVIMLSKSKKIFHSIFESILCIVADSQMSFEVTLRLNPVQLVLNNNFLEVSVLKAFSLHFLNYLVSHNASKTVSASDALQVHETWFDEAKGSLLLCILLKVYAAAELDDLKPILYSAIMDCQLNWNLSLILLHSYLTFNEASSLHVLSLVDDILDVALKERNMDLLFSSFLIIRHCVLVGPPHFALSYSAWFKKKFCTEYIQCFSEKETFTFFAQFLTGLVPSDKECYLKAHIENKPPVPTGYRHILMDYIKLMRTRLDDIKAKELAGSILDKVVASFEATNKIPSTILEACMLRKHQYLTQFLPHLLAPRLLPSKPDGRMCLIEALRKDKKIPKDMYENYIAECEKLAAEDLVVCLDDSFDVEAMETE